MGFADSVWERTAASHAMGKRAYVSLISFWTLVGIAMTGVTAYACQDLELGWWMLAVIAAAFGGTFLALYSDNPFLSFIGYMLVAVPFGAMLGPVVALYSPGTVIKVAAITTGMVLLLGAVGVVWPRSLESWHPYLLGALWILLLGLFAMPLLSWAGLDVSTAMGIWDWVGVVLFGALVIFDLNRAMRIERTLDNSIDVALAVYLDWLNIAIRLLSIMGGNSSSND